MFWVVTPNKSTRRHNPAGQKRHNPHMTPTSHRLSAQSRQRKQNKFLRIHRVYSHKSVVGMWLKNTPLAYIKTNKPYGPLTEGKLLQIKSMQYKQQWGAAEIRSGRSTSIGRQSPIVSYGAGPTKYRYCSNLRHFSINELAVDDRLFQQSKFQFNLAILMKSIFYTKKFHHQRPSIRKKYRLPKFNVYSFPFLETQGKFFLRNILIQLPYGRRNSRNEFTIDIFISYNTIQK
jgi:hypothetical protein